MTGSLTSPSFVRVPVAQEECCWSIRPNALVEAPRSDLACPCPKVLRLRVATVYAWFSHRRHHRRRSDLHHGAGPRCWACRCRYFVSHLASALSGSLTLASSSACHAPKSGPSRFLPASAGSCWTDWGGGTKTGKTHPGGLYPPGRASPPLYVSCDSARRHTGHKTHSRRWRTVRRGG